MERCGVTWVQRGHLRELERGARRTVRAEEQAATFRQILRRIEGGCAKPEKTAAEALRREREAEWVRN